MEFIKDMKRITPNLKKIRIRNTPSDTINALLETLENLESVEILCSDLEISSYKVYPNIKHLHVHNISDFKFRAAQLPQQFLNLEFLKIIQNSFESTEPFFVTLLSGLKRLKTLRMNIWSDTKINSAFILSCFDKYGNHLETVRVSAGRWEPLVRYSGYIGFAINKEPNECFRFE